MKFALLTVSLYTSLVTASLLSDLVRGRALRENLPWKGHIGFFSQAALRNEMDSSNRGSQKANSQDTSDGVNLADVLPGQSTIRIFTDLVRSVDSAQSRLNSSGMNSTVLAPLNSEILNMPKKPWEASQDYQALGDDAYKGQGGQDRAEKNLKRFVESHIVTASPLQEGSKVKTMNGDEIWFEIHDGRRVLQPANIEVAATVEQVVNGEVWTLKGVVKHP